MKKNVFLILSFLFILITTGCVREDFTVNINKDKSMSVVITTTVEEETGNRLFTKEVINNLENNGFFVEKVSEEFDDKQYVQYILTRIVKNIDEISEVGEVVVNIKNNTLKNKDNFSKSIFSIDKGFFKNKYEANFIYKDFNYELDENNLYLEFHVNLPYSAISSNATSASSDNTTLTWDLLSLKDKTIEFEFELYNLTTIYYMVGLIVIVISFCIYFTCMNSNNKKVYNKNDEVKLDKSIQK